MKPRRFPSHTLILALSHAAMLAFVAVPASVALGEPPPKTPVEPGFAASQHSGGVAAQRGW
jgi:hypothetical protein